MSIWTIFLWLADTAHTDNIAKFFLNFAVFFLSIVSWLFLLFALNYPDRTKKYYLLSGVGVLYNVYILWAAIHEKIITSVSLTIYGSSIQQSTLLYSVHTIQATSFIVAGLIALNLRKKALPPSEGMRISLMTLGIIVAFLGNGLAGIVAIYVPGNTWLNLVATVSTVSFVVIIGYTIIKHRLFDVRAFVARFVGYVLSLGLIGLTSSLILYNLSNAFANSKLPRAIQQLFYIVIVLVFAIAYQPLKKRFDKLTRRLFYQDGYDTQDFLDEFNKTVVSTIDMKRLLLQSSDVIKDYLKTLYSGFFIVSSDSKKFRKFRLSEIDDDALKRILIKIQNSKKRILIKDDLSSKADALNSTMADLNTGIIVRVYSSPSKEDVYLVLGVKKSGSSFSKQDLAVIEIITNELVIAIQNAMRFEEIQAFNITLQEKIDHATKQLRSANQRLKALDETKDDFISMASHQLRTPLTSVKGYLSMVLEGDAGKVSGEQRKFLSQAFASSQKMVYLIADLLNVSRLRTGKFVIERTPTNLADVVQSEVDQLVETAANKDLELTYQKPEHFPVMQLDETKIRQVIMNFMDNAIYYTPKGGHIKVELSELPKSIEFKVIDDGIGVPKNEIHHLFNKFYRAGNARKARPDGTGLGLFMAKKVVIAQDGAIIFQTEEGKGSTFGFSFAKQ